MINKDKFKIGDLVRSPNSLWSDDIGSISGIVNKDIIHVIFPENDKHYGYQQTFSHSQLTKINLKYEE